MNGVTWPYLEVEQRRYRFRFLNGCNSRFLILKLDQPGLAFWQIGAEGGFLDAPVRREQLLIAPAERANVIVDFTHVPVGTQILTRNLGPDAFPFGPTAALLGTVNADGTGKPLEWREAITETPTVGATEVWAIHNFTEDAHPIHVHMVMFEVVERESMETGAVRGPEPWEAGPKDTVIAFP